MAITKRIHHMETSGVPSQRLIDAVGTNFHEFSTKGEVVIFFIQIYGAKIECRAADSDAFYLRLEPHFSGATAPQVTAEILPIIREFGNTINSQTCPSRGWLQIRPPAGELGFESEILISPYAPPVDAVAMAKLLNETIIRTAETLKKWWPGIQAIHNEGIDAKAALSRCQ